MSWLFSQALVAEYSEANCLDGVPSAQLNAMPTPQQFWRNDKMMDCSKLSQFGLTLQLLTENLGGELLTWFRAASPARTFHARAQVEESRGPGLDSGWKWPESSVKFDPLTASWKIRQCSLLGGSDVFSETWPRWGTMQNGECWERIKSGPGTSENESGLWPTLTRRDYRNSSDRKRGAQGPDLIQFICRATGQSGIRLKPTFCEDHMGWPIGWTELKPLAMDSFRQWQQQHLGL